MLQDPNLQVNLEQKTNLIESPLFREVKVKPIINVKVDKRFKANKIQKVF